MGKIKYYTYRLDFSEDRSAISRFILLYGDLFHSWSEDNIKSMCTITHFDKPLPKLYGSKYRHYETTYDEIQEKRVRQGFAIYDNDIMEIHCTPEDFKKIRSEITFVEVSSTRRHGRKTYKYVGKD